MTNDDFNKALGILCAWREARGEGNDGMRAVLHVINNRSNVRTKSWAQIIFQRLQFTSMTYGQDPELCLVPTSDDSQYMYLASVVDSVYDGSDNDNTLGATNYFANTIPVPSWASTMTKTVQIGKHTFYK
jgi:N-acetylmuramoyl-L-alanine amidase